MNTRRSRRDFLKSVATVTAAAPTLLQAQALSLHDRVAQRQDPARGDWLGIRGQQDLRSALKTPGVELAAVADVYEGRLALRQRSLGQPGGDDA
jgi:hypothetical protein